MNVLIAADMEGIAGIDDYRDCLPSHPAAYTRGCELMTEEVLVAFEALRRGGVDRISVGDWHMVGTNVLRDRMPAGVEVRPIADLALKQAEPSFTNAQGGGALDAVVLLGHHASTTNSRGFSSHTFVWDMEVELNGESLSEVREELDPGELGGARLVATKEGMGRGCASSYDRARVHAEPAEGIAAALASLFPAAPRLRRRVGALVATPVMRSKERRWLASSP